jgi:hypothetical protein
MDNLKFYGKFVVRGVVSLFLPSIITTVALEETTQLVEKPIKYVYDSINKVKIFKSK